jgi:hypothetical protein
MPQFAQCFFLEWGWPFLLVLLGGGVLLAVVVGIVIWFFGFRYWREQPGGERTILGFDKWKFETSGRGVTLGKMIVAVVGIAAVLGGSYYVVKSGYDNYQHAYAVSLDSPSVPVELEKVRERFQGETNVTITVAEPAKKFAVTGTYHGACVKDLMDSICRQHASRISCETSLLRRTLLVDVAKSK